ncbi:hypothetical protein JKG68_30810 [Microvirga aerilata]|uniref:Uncharacterized protein n=1 Tax=Microvirga aerilata TaxID=670292 RepID=A0A936ZJI4_9HYPH|nr:hypothetical protein [Microvirga aerilata]MBL0408274.1 hypothetical protein [Microvirga aerilata]
MTTERKRQANQRNAQRSTGPKTSAGKARSKQNAWKHGLAVPVEVQPHFADLIHDLKASLKQDIAPAQPTEEDLQAVAVAMLEVVRVQSVQCLLLDELAQHCSGRSAADSSSSRSGLAELMQHLLRVDRYERRALSRRKFAIRSLGEANAERG